MTAERRSTVFWLNPCEMGNELVVNWMVQPTNLGLTELSRRPISHVDRLAIWKRVDSISRVYSTNMAAKLVDVLHEESAALFDAILEPRARNVISNGAAAIVVASNIAWIPWELLLIEPDRKQFLGDVATVIRMPTRLYHDDGMGAGVAGGRLTGLVHVAHPEFILDKWRALFDIQQVRSLRELSDVTRDARVIHLLGHNEKGDHGGMRLHEDVIYSVRSIGAFRFPANAFVHLSACHAAESDAAEAGLGWEVVRRCQCTVLATPCALPVEEGWRLAAALVSAIQQEADVPPSKVWQRLRRSDEFQEEHPFSRCFFQYGNYDDNTLNDDREARRQ